jgi:hypothetical protein
MKVQFTLPVSSKSGSFHTGEVAEIPDPVGRQWVKAGYCNEAAEGESARSFESAGSSESIETPAAAQMRRGRRTQIAV